MGEHTPKPQVVRACKHCIEMLLKGLWFLYYSEQCVHIMDHVLIGVPLLCSYDGATSISDASLR